MKICKVKGCENKIRCSGYCNRHYLQIRRYGEILERTIRDKNEIIDCGGYSEICIYNKKGKEIARTKIDKEDFEEVKGHKWCLNSGYVITIINNKTVGLHQLLLGKKQDFIIDHRDANPLNNKKQNLRHCTDSQNRMNQKNVKGYYWDEKREKWRVRIAMNNKQLHLGYFIKKQDAIKVRRQAEQKYFGEFAYRYNS